jgi:hypothetical protein
MSSAMLASVCAVAAAFVYGFHRHGGPGMAQRFAAGATIWLALTGWLAWSGKLAFGSLPPPVMLLVTVAFALTTWFGLSRYGTLLVERAGLGFLIGFQVFRVLVEVALWLGHREGIVPVQMTWEGRNLDVLTGLTAPLVAFAKLPRAAILVWNIAGLALLANIVGVAILSMPTPLRLFMNEPANRFVATWPHVWLPTFLVQAAWLGHLLVFRWLRQTA